MPETQSDPKSSPKTLIENKHSFSKHLFWFTGYIVRKWADSSHRWGTPKWGGIRKLMKG